MSVSSEIKIGLDVIYHLLYMNVCVFSCAGFMSPQYPGELQIVLEFIFGCTISRYLR